MAHAGGQRNRLEVRGKSLDLDGFLGVLDAQDDHGLAEEGLAMVGLEALGGELAAIIDTDNVGILGREIDLVFGPGQSVPSRSVTSAATKIVCSP